MCWKSCISDIFWNTRFLAESIPLSSENPDERPNFVANEPMKIERTHKNVKTYGSNKKLQCKRCRKISHIFIKYLWDLWWINRKIIKIRKGCRNFTTCITSCRCCYLREWITYKIIANWFIYWHWICLASCLIQDVQSCFVFYFTFLSSQSQGTHPYTKRTAGGGEERAATASKWMSEKEAKSD